jgi:mitotic spindle assembly checkpoint protein MAD2
MAFVHLLCSLPTSASAAMQQGQTQKVSLRGSVATVAEFFGFAVNNILYQRAVYPPDSFAQVSKYGMPLMISKDDQLKRYLGNVLAQLANWLSTGEVKKLVLVVNGVKSGAVLERWVFDVDTSANGPSGAAARAPPKTDEHIRGEVQALMRQLTASVSFMPVIEEPCAFDLLVYASAECSVPEAWELSDPHIIQNATDVKLRSFSTQFHKVDASVSFAE